MIEPGRVAHQPRLDLAQACCPRQLAKQQRQELTLAGQLPHPVIGFMLVHKPIEHAHGTCFRSE